MARRRDERDVAGVLLVDKPTGPTSHDVVQRIRRAVGQGRVGHTGTLDPAATGVLVVCLGRAAKLVRFLQAGRKTYAATMVLGVTTDTQDADGSVLREVDASHVTERALCEVLVRHQGEIEQLPPMVSAVKVRGVRLHEHARRGEDVERSTRQVTVHDLVLDGFEGGTHPRASFLVTCSAGTYVRTLAHDVGESLGVGGSLVSLRRLANGPFTVDEASTPEQVDAAAAGGALSELLLDPAAAVARCLPVVQLDDPSEALRAARSGRLPVQGAPGRYAVFHAGRLLGIFEDADDGTARSQLVWTRPEELGS